MPKYTTVPVRLQVLSDAQHQRRARGSPTRGLRRTLREVRNAISSMSLDRRRQYRTTCIQVLRDVQDQHF
jgi:hypothetical protein